MHAEDDLDIPVWHAQKLFDAFLEDHLPALPELTQEMMAVIGAVGSTSPDDVAEMLEVRTARRRELVREHHMERVGRVEVFEKDRAGGEVVFLHTRWGAHNVGLVEGVQDFMADMFDMGSTPSVARLSI